MTVRDSLSDRDYLYFRFDVTGMTEAEVDALTGEVICQGEASDNHGDVAGPTQSFGHAEFVQRVRRGLARGGKVAAFHLSDETAEDYETTEDYTVVVVASLGEPLGKGDGPNLMANVRLDDEATETLGNAADLCKSRGSVALFDPQDPGDEPLYLIDFTEGVMSVYATDCVETGELERRLVRYFGTDGWEILTVKERVS